MKLVTRNVNSNLHAAAETINSWCLADKLVSLHAVAPELTIAVFRVDERFDLDQHIARLTPTTGELPYFMQNASSLSALAESNRTIDARIAAGDNKVTIWREYRRLSIRDLSRATALSTSRLAAIEKNINAADDAALLKIAGELKIPVGYLI